MTNALRFRPRRHSLGTARRAAAPLGGLVLATALVALGCGDDSTSPSTHSDTGAGGASTATTTSSAASGGNFGVGGTGPGSGTAGSPSATSTGTTGGAGGTADTGGAAGAAGDRDAGGTSDANGSPDANSVSDGSLPSCVTAGTELCDDFESGQLDAKKWKINKPTSSATVTVDGEHVHSGHFAVHIKVVPGQQTTAQITEAVTFPAMSNSFYARIYAYFSPDLPAATGGDFHTGFVIGSGKNDVGDVQAGLGLIGGAKQFLGYSIFYGPPKYEFGPWSATKVTPNQWLCLELFENGAMPTAETRQIWVDGKELTDLRSNSSANGAPANHNPPQFNLVSIGLWEYHPTPTLSDMWIDDVRVSSQKIGCDN